MKILQMLTRVLLLIAAFSAVLFAGDYADVKLIGFSTDGKYMAFEESGSWDGSGGDYATTYYVDVAANKYAMPPSTYEWDMDSMKGSRKRLPLSAYKAKVTTAINKLKIVRGNTGRQVIAHLLNDWSYVEMKKSETYFTDSDGEETAPTVTDYVGGMISRGAGTEKIIFNPQLWSYTQNTTDFYELTLTSSETNSGEECSEGLRSEMTIKDNTHHRELPIQMLQKDGPKIPESRHSPFGYKVEQVYFYKNRLAVIVNVFSQGFEGPDMRYIAVTGKLEHEANEADR